MKEREEKIFLEAVAQNMKQKGGTSQRRFNSSQKKLLLFRSKKLFEIINFLCYGK